MNQGQNAQWMDQYVSDLFDEHGFEAMTEESRAEFIPQFSAQLQQRLGLAAMKELSKEAQDELGELMSKDDWDQKELQDFWTKNIPNYEEVVKKVLDDFAVEFKNIMANA